MADLLAAIEKPHKHRNWKSMHLIFHGHQARLAVTPAYTFDNGMAVYAINN